MLRVTALVAVVVAVLQGGCAGRPVERAKARAPEAQERWTGNPILPGWYADPEAVRYGGRYWIYPTYSDAYARQVRLDAFSSPDLATWTWHPRVLTTEGVAWVKRALWAPAAIEKDGKYYLFFSGNDIQKDGELGGIGVAVSDRPEGPFKDLIGKPLVGEFHNGAQPIDQYVFRDDDGAYYLVYGGWRHCNIARLSDDFRSLVPFEDGTTFREITPEGYVEGPLMFRRRGKLYFMWSEGGWTGPDYSVAYAVADSVRGPFTRVGKVLEQDPEIAMGAGHHSVLRLPGPDGELGDAWAIVYHRRPAGVKEPNHREVCIEYLRFDAQGRIEPVRVSREGVRATPLARE